ncbi:hypothetical protein AB205_0043730 [Aquarana catesbeiana]|uniref:Uncharacterized protein n=1 Tax=Aquarana catesbeiana TaxID=8400 RepID=A0A2G9R783_AQUCT|nr:hypothetical protein AB205_0043730 [Aquarana catesbeiana]
MTYLVISSGASARDLCLEIQLFAGLVWQFTCLGAVQSPLLSCNCAAISIIGAHNVSEGGEGSRRLHSEAVMCEPDPGTHCH